MTRFALVALAVTAAGCSDGGPGRFDVAGKVTFAGRPVMNGRIFFDPDPARKNDGPQGYAPIVNGEYDTARAGRGSVGGPMVVRVSGVVDPVAGPLVAEFHAEADLPRQRGSFDLDVPASAGQPYDPKSGAP